MANMKQQIKRYKNADKKHAVNVAFKSSLKTSIKKTVNAINTLFFVLIEIPPFIIFN